MKIRRKVGSISVVGTTKWSCGYAFWSWWKCITAHIFLPPSLCRGANAKAVKDWHSHCCVTYHMETYGACAAPGDLNAWVVLITTRVCLKDTFKPPHVFIFRTHPDPLVYLKDLRIHPDHLSNIFTGPIQTTSRTHPDWHIGIAQGLIQTTIWVYLQDPSRPPQGLIQTTTWAYLQDLLRLLSLYQGPI